MATYAGKIAIEGETLLIGSTLYGVCKTAADATDKTVPVAGFDELMTGVTVHVKFENGNIALRPTIDVNNTGAKPVRLNTDEYGIQSAPSGSVYALTFDGSAWIVNS